MTIVEVMAAMVTLIIGVLGTLVLIEGSLSSTSRTTAREQGTNLARDLVERSRQVPYASTDTKVNLGTAAAALRATLLASDNAEALASAADREFTAVRRGVTYLVTISACSIDDPTDGVSVGNSSFCANSSGTTGPGSSDPGPAPARNVLGVDVGLIYASAGGSLLTTVCNALQGSLLTQVTSVLSRVVPVSLCPSGTGNSSVAIDGHPDDMRRVRIDVAWNRGGAGSLSQTTLLTNPRQN
ncbi:MAG: hypothetical protein WKF96_15870 [Solirubrobacteraceae bacterium]